MVGIRGIVNGPDFVALPHALWEAVQHPAEEGPHWRQGVTWQDWCGGASTTYASACGISVTGTGGGPPSASSLTATAGVLNRGATAFTVYAEYDCSLVGLPDTDQAVDALARSEAYQASHAFWTGRAGGQTTVWPHLASNTVLDDPQGIRLQTAASPVLTGADDVAVIVGQIDAHLASEYGGEGLVHVPPVALSTLQSRVLARPDDTGVLRTPGGHRIVAAAGYDGSAPDGSAAAPGTAWIYATGAMFGYRGDVVVRDFPGTFDRAKNTVRKLASRTYLFGFECVHVGALVTLGVPT